MKVDRSLSVTAEGNYLKIFEPGNAQNSCSILFHRTLRIPDDDKVYPLPPSLGHFPICKVDDYLDKVPEDWKKTGGIFFPMHQREAMWMQFQCPTDRPKAIKIAVGKVNAINGKPWTNQLEENDYITIPRQPWLDGINAGGKGTIKQFVAMPLGSGYSVEAQVTGEEKFGGIQMIVFDSKEDERVRKYPPVSVYSTRGRHGKGGAPPSAFASGCFYGGAMDTDEECELEGGYLENCNAPCLTSASSSAASFPYSQELQQTKKKQSRSRDSKPAKEMSLSAGGSMKQEISEDEHGLQFWDRTCFARVYVRIVNSEMYEQITGKKAPPTPITAQTYSSYGYPWFDIYNESPQSSIDQSNVLNQVKSVKQVDKQKYAWPQQEDTSIQLSSSQVKSLYHNKNTVRDGDW